MDVTCLGTHSPASMPSASPGGASAAGSHGRSPEYRSMPSALLREHTAVTSTHRRVPHTSQGVIRSQNRLHTAAGKSRGSFHADAVPSRGIEVRADTAAGEAVLHVFPCR